MYMPPIRGKMAVLEGVVKYLHKKKEKEATWMELYDEVSKLTGYAVMQGNLRAVVYRRTAEN